MRQHRLVTRFSPVKKIVAANLRRLNECQQISQESPGWNIYIGINKGVIGPENMIGIGSDVILNRLPRQQIIIFESDTKAYVAMCDADFIPKVVKVAEINDSEKVFTFVRKLAP